MYVNMYVYCSSHVTRQSTGRQKASLLFPPLRSDCSVTAALGISMDWHERLSLLYNLYPIEQDWGICNANGDRVGEFIDIFLNHKEEDPWEWEELADLVFQSTNNAIKNGSLTEEQKIQVILIVAEHKDKFPNQLKYWLDFSNEIDYPVKKLINKGNW